MRRILLLIAMAFAFQMTNAKDNDYQLCSECGFYHFAEDDCDEVKESKDPKYFDANIAKKRRYKEFDAISLQNGIHLTIIEGEEEFVMVNGSKTILKGFMCRNRKTTLMLSSKYSKRQMEENEDSTMCHVLICRSPKKPLKIVKATTGCKVVFQGVVDQKSPLIVEVASGSEVDINADMAELKCIAKSASQVNLTANCDTLTVIAETMSKIDLVGKAKRLLCSASFASDMEVDIESKRMHVQLFTSELTAIGNTDFLFANAVDVSKCYLQDMIAKWSDAYAYNMSEMHVSSTHNLNSLADKMSLLYVYKVDKNKPVYITDDSGERVRDRQISTDAVNYSKYY